MPFFKFLKYLCSLQSELAKVSVLNLTIFVPLYSFGEFSNHSKSFVFHHQKTWLISFLIYYNLQMYMYF